MTRSGRPRRPVVLVAVAALGLVAACGAQTPPQAGAPDLPGSTPGSSSATPPGTAAPSGSPSSSPSPSSPSASSDADAPREATGEPVTLAFGGDVHFEGEIGEALAEDPATTFGPVADVLSEADVAVVNLETAVGRGGDPAPKRFTFRAPRSAFDAVAAAGVDVVSLANNHGMDFGQEGLAATLAAAQEAGVPLVGAGEDADAAYAPWRTEVSGQRLAVFGATQVLDSFALDAWRAQDDQPGLASAKEAGLPELLAAVRAERGRADTVVVVVHWGGDREQCPLPRQEDLAARLAAAGADVVVGSHAHVLLGGGYLADGPGAGAYVDYGLGNFVFLSRPGLDADSGVLRLTVRGRAVTEAEWVPAVISAGRPRPVTGKVGGAVVAQKEALRERCTDLLAEPSPA